MVKIPVVSNVAGKVAETAKSVGGKAKGLLKKDEKAVETDVHDVEETVGQNLEIAGETLVQDATLKNTSAVVGQKVKNK